MLDVILVILYILLLGVAGVAIWRLRFAYRHFTRKQLLTGAAIVENMPGVTVCIPARNEQHALAECLEAVIRSNYPKLEIIVIDDLSADETPVLIKSFAHEGVRFVEGSALPGGWLGKNHALQELLHEASGTYVFFMDVDTRIQPDTIEQMVAYMVQEDALMLSVLPRRDDGWRASVLFSTLRYFWELIFHRPAAPAAAGNAWMIDRRTLLDRWDGLTAFKDAIQPESRFAAALMAEGRYRFLISSALLGVGYEKKWTSQVETSVRLLFPLIGSKPAHTIIVALDLLIIASPLLIVGLGFVLGWGFHQLAAGILWLVFAGLYGSYLRRVWRRGWWLGALLWPVIVMQEAVILIVSTERYLHQAVTWKGRSVRLRRP